MNNTLQQYYTYIIITVLILIAQLTGTRSLPGGFLILYSMCVAADQWMKYRLGEWWEFQLLGITHQLAILSEPYKYVAILCCSIINPTTHCITLLAGCSTKLSSWALVIQPSIFCMIPNAAKSPARSVWHLVCLEQDAYSITILRWMHQLNFKIVGAFTQMLISHYTLCLGITVPA